MNQPRGSAQNGGSNLTTMQAKDPQQQMLEEIKAPTNGFLLGQ